ncbi:MAG: polysaccharide biosynthesis C-terminal domain-containing protein [Oscillospiraceae bacterium]|nr:polysaccharide biosynthesis C-terminal domain-containing protein [Oscillospiraceae bacterium]
MNKYKTLALNTVVFGIGTFGSKILAFLLTRLYTKYFAGAFVFNIKEVLEMCANMLIPLVSMSVTDAVIRYGLDKNYEKEAVFSNAAAILSAGCIGFLVLSPLLLLYEDIRPHVPLLIGYVLCSCFRQLSAQFARARGKVKLYAADGIFCTLAFFLANVVLIAKLRLGITGFMLSNMFADLASGTCVWLIAGHRRFLSRKFIDKELLSVMLRFSLPLIPTAELWLITGFSDRIFVKYIVNPTEAGVYGAATKVPNLIAMASTIFYQAWNMSAIQENDSATKSKFYAQVYDAYQAMLAMAAGFIIVFVRFLSKVLIVTSTDHAYEHAYLYTPVLVVAVLMMCYNQFFSSIYTVTKHTRNSFWTSLVAAIVNLVLNAVLIPRYEVQGAILATFASYFVCFVIRLFDARRYVSFDVAYVRFFVNLLVLFLMCGVIFCTDPMMPEYAESQGMVPVLLGFGLLILTVFNVKPLLATARKLLRRK